MTTDIISDAVITFKAAGDSNYTTYQTTQNIASQRNIGLSANYSKQIVKGTSTSSSMYTTTIIRVSWTARISM
jgi:hypothetical protein